MTRQARERALMIIADAMFQTGVMTGEGGMLDRMYSYIAADGNIRRYENHLRATIRAINENPEWPAGVLYDYYCALDKAQRA